MRRQINNLFIRSKRGKFQVLLPNGNGKYRGALTKEYEVLKTFDTAEEAIEYASNNRDFLSITEKRVRNGTLELYETKRSSK
jgi:hypothetical protein